MDLVRVHPVLKFPCVLMLNVPDIKCLQNKIVKLILCLGLITCGCKLSVGHWTCLTSFNCVHLCCVYISNISMCTQHDLELLVTGTVHD